MAAGPTFSWNQALSPTAMKKPTTGVGGTTEQGPGAAPQGSGPLAGETGQTPTAPSGNFWNGGSTGAPTTDNGSTEQNLSTTGRMSHATLQAGQQAGQDRNQFESLMGGGQQALNTYMSGALSAAMPSFNAQLEGVRESAARRGISTGDLGTSYEGDLASAFQRNFANAAAQQSMNLYDTQVGAVQKQGMFDTGNYEGGLGTAEDIAQKRKQSKNSGLGGLLGGIGAVAGGALGGPAGVGIGGQIGGAVGGMWS